MAKKYKTLDLFAGVGGIRIGFEKTGRFQTIMSNDNDDSCKQTYDLNFKTAKLDTSDIRFLDSNKAIPPFDVLLAGFPCQPFSIAGYKKGFEDTNNGSLFFEMFKIIKKYKPNVLFLENVKNLKGHDKGKTFKIIKESLETLGYRIHSQVLNSLYYGNIPQNRERIYIIGFNKNIKSRDNFKFPKQVPLTKSFKEFLEKERVDPKYYYNQRYPMFDKIKKSIQSRDTVYQWRRIYVRANKKGVCPTLTANMGSGGHNVPLILNSYGIRKLTPRECFNLQGFDKNYRLPNIADGKLYHQAGNSVVIPVISAVAHQIVRILDMSADKAEEKSKQLTINTRQFIYE